ncbi:hypothetical protein DFH29DRAFT_815147, partial [Suillus ampliporus]
DVAAFFGDPNLPQPSVNQVILDNESYHKHEEIEDENARDFFASLKYAMDEAESAIDDFIFQLFRVLNYNSFKRTIRL